MARSLRARLFAWHKGTPLNPYWMETRRLRRAVAGLAPRARGLLLDVGVGDRPYAALFAPHVRRYVGLEYPPACDNLNPGISARLQRAQGVVDVWGDGQRLPFANGLFDTVLSLEVLEHLPDPDLCVAELARVLAPGGTLLASVPFCTPLHALPYDYYRFTAAGIRALLERHGLSVESVTPRGNGADAAGAALAQHLLRTLGARAVHPDGAVSPSRWRAPLVLPLVALVQCWAALMSGLTRDESACLGYAVVARKPG
jgi:SAM-dependent methyltransferase